MWADLPEFDSNFDTADANTAAYKLPNIDKWLADTESGSTAPSAVHGRVAGGGGGSVDTPGVDSIEFRHARDGVTGWVAVYTGPTIATDRGGSVRGREMLIASTDGSTLMARWLKVALHRSGHMKEKTEEKEASFAALLHHDAVAHAIARATQKEYINDQIVHQPMAMLRRRNYAVSPLPPPPPLQLTEPLLHHQRATPATHYSPAQPQGVTNNHRQTTLLYVHIPKTGGTSIEAAAKAYGIKWGRHDARFKHSQHTDAVRGLPRLCRTAWHEPFQFHVSERPQNVQTFCVIRPAAERLVSEYNYRIKLQHGHTAANDQSTGCPTPQDLERWILVALDEYAKSKYAFDCHLLSSSAYAAGCNHMIPYTPGLAMLTVFLERHGLPHIPFGGDSDGGDSGGAVGAGGARKKHNAHLWNCSVSLADISPHVLDRINVAYPDDDALYKEALTNHAYSLPTYPNKNPTI